MCNDPISPRVTTGLFYNHTQRYMCHHKVNIRFTLNITRILQLRNIFHHTKSFLLKQINNILLIAIVMQILLLICRDVVGPNSASYSISILHLNIRSIRQKLEFIKENLLDYDILCFTESQLNEDISTESLLLDNFSVPFRKDRNNRGGDTLVYINNNILFERMTELEICWDECLWLKIIQKQATF